MAHSRPPVLEMVPPTVGEALTGTPKMSLINSRGFSSAKAANIKAHTPEGRTGERGWVASVSEVLGTTQGGSWEKLLSRHKLQKEKMREITPKY